MSGIAVILLRDGVGLDVPPTHDVTIAAEYLGETAHQHIRIWETLNIEVIRDRLVNHNGKVVLVG